MESQNVAPAPKKNNRTMIIIVIAVVLVCCCILTIGLVVFGSPVLKTLTAYHGIADAQLRTGTMRLLGQSESEHGCDNFSLASAEVLSQPDPSTGGSWTESWQISACGETHSYTILYTPSSTGGTDIHITSGN